MEYLKHKYSGRIYVVRRDHNPEKPYLWSPWDYTSRTPKKFVWDNFLTPCEKPPEMPRHYDISIAEEMEWEKAHMPEEPKKATEEERPPAQSKLTPAPKKASKAISASAKGKYTLKDLCMEIGMEPSQARRLLRSSGKKPPSGGWVWDSPKEVEGVKRFLKKSQ